MMTYAPEYDRLWQEARALSKQEADAATAITASGSPRERAHAASALLALRIRLSSVIAAISEGQAGGGRAFRADPAPEAGAFPALEQALTSLEERLSAMQQPASS